jgi:hypothetical protein
MKKWIPVTAFVLLAALAGIYIFIPARLDIVQITPVNCTVNGAYRTMAATNNWHAWWPGTQSDSNTLHFQNGTWQITQKLMNTLEIHIQYTNIAVNSALYLLPVAIDSTTLQWKCSIATGANPFTRIQHYRQAVAIKHDMAAILDHFKSFAEKKENIYGIRFHETVFKDSFVISTKTAMAAYPATAAVYSSITALKKYSEAHQAQPTGYPIMNILALNPAGYQLMTAIPVDRSIPASGNFINQRIPLNHFLVTRVQGGDARVKQALAQFNLYIQDYHRTVMALPFQQLITDRSAEPDTTRWVTDIYYPLF